MQTGSMYAPAGFRCRSWIQISKMYAPAAFAARRRCRSYASPQVDHVIQNAARSPMSHTDTNWQFVRPCGFSMQQLDTNFQKVRPCGIRRPATVSLVRIAAGRSREPKCGALADVAYRCKLAICTPLRAPVSAGRCKSPACTLVRVLRSAYGYKLAGRTPLRVCVAASATRRGCVGTRGQAASPWAAFARSASLLVICCHSTK